MNDLTFILEISRGLTWNTIRSIFAWLDSVAYTLFSWIMQLIFDVAAVSTDPAFNRFYDAIHSRIYAVLAIFMLFKITISMLAYLVNPDSISDKERGVGKMATRVVVSLVMLIAFPSAFQFLNRVQPHILEALPRIVLGTSSVSVDESTGSVTDSSNLGGQMSSIGEQMAFDTYNGVWFNTGCKDFGQMNSQGTTNTCFKYGNTVSIAVEHVNDPVDGDKSTYQYDYMPVFGFITAIIMSIILIGFCIDIAIRVFKLIILQIIAPIPIISYIDPKSSKDGAFSKWLKMVGSVYLDLFIKLAVIYFVLLVISELITSGVVLQVALNIIGANLDTYGLQGGAGGAVARAGLILVALIIGLLFFAKEAPKFIADALGIKLNENNKLFGGLGKIMAAGAIGAGAIGSGIASGRASYLSDEANGKDHNAGRLLKNVGAGLLGGVTGLGTGASAAVNAKDHNAQAVMDAMAKRNSQTMAYGREGGTFLGGAGSAVGQLFSGQSMSDGLEAEWKAEEERIKNDETILKNISDANAHRKNIMERAKSKVVDSEKTTGSYTTSSGQTITGNYRDYNSQLSAALAGNYYTKQWYEDASGTRISVEEYNSNPGYAESGNFALQQSVEKYFNFNGQEITLSEGESIKQGLMDSNTENYYELALSDQNFDASITADVESYQIATGKKIEGKFGTLKAAFGSDSAKIARENDALNKRRTAVSEQKQSIRARRAQVQDKRFRGNKNG